MTNTTKTNKITRKIAAMLAAVMAMTTMASIGASAATEDAVRHMSVRSSAASAGFVDDTKITVNKDEKMIPDLSI